MDMEVINSELQKLVSSDTKMISDPRHRLYTLLTIIDVDIPASVCNSIEKIILCERVKSLSLIDIITPNNINNINNINNTKNSIHLYKGDITVLEVDAIVNAANSGMLGCFDPTHKCIDNIIHSKAGPRLRMECRDIIKGCNGRKNKILVTNAYCLPSKYIIHVAGPIYHHSKDQSRDLSNCYSICLEIARKYNLKSIAFCCISTGLYGYPKNEAARIAIYTVRGWLKLTKYPINVIFDVFTEDDYQIYKSILF
jgi:O-acetyl-ADP-ribose deacetylase (regulator of RNase III)